MFSSTNNGLTSELLSGHSQDAHNVINGRVSKFCGAFFSYTVINHDTSVLSGALTTQEMLTSFSCIMSLRWDFFTCIKGLNKDIAVQVK